MKKKQQKSQCPTSRNVKTTLSESKKQNDQKKSCNSEWWKRASVHEYYLACSYLSSKEFNEIQ